MNFVDKKIFATLFFAIFATVTGVGIVVPLLPVYAHELGAGGFYVGMIFGAFSLARTFFYPALAGFRTLKGANPLSFPDSLPTRRSH
jgi:DHA1 family multidrug resistance protein-like MFS transporter